LSKELLPKIAEGNFSALAKAISIVENELSGYRDLLEEIAPSSCPIIGVTGPPGAGKSSLVNALVSLICLKGKKAGIIAIDPSSPFSHGSIMGDRLRMFDNFLNDKVFIRSMASRGSLGGLAPKVFEVADLMKSAGFDFIIIETVGVGQSEVEIAALADINVLVLVPESGDDIQALKSGILEIADIYVVNKADRPGADVFERNLFSISHQNSNTPIIKTIAIKNEGIDQLFDAILQHQTNEVSDDHKNSLLAERALMMIKSERTRDISLDDIAKSLKQEKQGKGFNFYKFVKSLV